MTKYINMEMCLIETYLLDTTDSFPITAITTRENAYYGAMHFNGGPLIVKNQCRLTGMARTLVPNLRKVLKMFITGRESEFGSVPISG